MAADAKRLRRAAVKLDQSAAVIAAVEAKGGGWAYHLEGAEALALEAGGAALDAARSLEEAVEYGQLKPLCEV